MMIDTSAYLGHWPFRKVICSSAGELDALAQKSGVTHMLVASLNALFYKDAMDGNRELAAALSAYQGKTKLMPLAVINPLYPAWERDLQECVEKLGFCGLELAPVYHNYKLAEDGVAAFKRAASLGIPVRINFEFENFRQHSHLDPADLLTEQDFTALIEAADTTLIVNSALPQSFGLHLVSLIKARGNVFFDFCRLDDFATTSLPDAISLLGINHFCLGTRSPFSYAEPQLVKLCFSLESDAERRAVLSENIRPYLPL